MKLIFCRLNLNKKSSIDLLKKKKSSIDFVIIPYITFNKKK